MKTVIGSVGSSGLRAIILAVFCALSFAPCSHAAKMFLVTGMEGGQPAIDIQTTPYRGYVFIGSAGDYGGYLFSGTQEELEAIAALSDVLSLGAYSELDNTLSEEAVTKINTWLEGSAFTLRVTGSWTHRQAVEAIMKEFNGGFSVQRTDILDSGEGGL
jgi:hypothetical protein